MEPILVFLGVATLIGLVLRVLVRQRLRVVARRPDASDDQICELQQANRITSFAVAASAAGLAIVALAYAILEAG